MIPFSNLDSQKKERLGGIELFSDSEPIEMDVEANGWTFHVVVGEHQNGRYICIPNWNIGTELSRLNDEFWNRERLRKARLHGQVHCFQHIGNSQRRVVRKAAYWQTPASDKGL